MLQRLVANWLRQQAQEAVMRSLNPDSDTSRERASDEAESGDAHEVDVACFFSDSGEAGGFVDKLADVHSTKCNGFTERVGQLGDRRIAIVEAPLEHEKLALVCRDVIQLRQPAWVLASGLAIGLDESVRKGDIVVARRVIDEAEYSLDTGTRMESAKALHVGTLMTVADLPQTQQQKKALSRHKALACDRQAAVIAEVCRVLKRRTMCVHCVAEALTGPSNQMARKVRSQDSIAGMAGAVAGALLDQPRAVKAFWDDKETVLRLSDRQANFLRGMIEQLPVD